MVITVIIACEVAFWIVLVAGLAVRYVARRPRLGATLLMLAPVLDLVLLTFVAIDLLHGGTASWQHGLGAIYIGASIAYGHAMIRWVDVRFAHRFAGGPAPVKLTGTAYTVLCWKDMGRTALMAVITCSVLGGLILLVGDAQRTEPFNGTFRIVAIIVVIDLIRAVGYTIWPKPQVAAHE